MKLASLEIELSKFNKTNTNLVIHGHVWLTST